MPSQPARLLLQRRTCGLNDSDIQEKILFLPRVERGRDPIREHAVRPIAATAAWRKQQRMWRYLLAR